MAVKNPPAILDDSPKAEPEEDRLGYRDFAKRLATSLSAIRADNGYVVGLQGPWGSGKSTVLNFVKAYLRQGERDRDLVVVDFAPWLISGHQDLIAGFFKVLGEAVSFSDARDEAQSRQAKRLAAKAVDPVFKGVGEVVAALRPELGHVAKPIANATGAVLSKALANWANEPSLQVAYNKLRVSLRADRRRFVVFIDDLDRLEPDEIKAIAQMVKSVGGLPHVTYVLAYDRDIVWPALDRASNQNGKRFYAEKIIQHEVSLPVPSRTSLTRLLDEQTGFLIADTPNDGHWADIVQNGIHRWMKSVRDVVRLSNALAFAGPTLAGELDPRDLLAMEGLRLFDSATFAWVRDNRDYLIGDGRYQLIRKDEKNDLVRQLHEIIAGPTKAELLALLCTLFPTRSQDLAAGERPLLNGGSETYANLSARRGIATRDGFTAYFSLSIAETSVSHRDVDAFLSALDEKDRLTAYLDTYLNRRDEAGVSLIAPFLEQVRYRFESEGAPAPTQPLISALVAIADPVMRIDDLTNGFEQSPLRYYTALIETLLRRAGQAEAGRLLEGGFADGATAAGAADLLVDRGRELGVIPTSGHPGAPLIDRATYDRLGPGVLDLIVAAANDGSLAQAPRYWDVLRIWKQFGNADDARAWVRDTAAASGQALAKIALGLLAWSVGTRGRGYFLNSRPPEDDFSLPELRDLCVRHSADPGLTDEDRSRLAALQRGLEKALANPNGGEDLDD